MNELFDKARKLLSAWKGKNYVFGRGVLGQLGKLAAGYGKNALVVCNSANMGGTAGAVMESLKAAGVTALCGAFIPGARPNSPRADVYRIETYILHYRPDVIVAAGGGSTIDASKAANFLAALGGVASPEIDSWFGTGIVSGALEKTGKKLTPLVAVQTAASSGSHLTKYSNITDPVSGQKKLIVDDAITPQAALFDYDVTSSMPWGLTVDGVLDSFAHCFEVFTGLPQNAPKEKYELCEAITGTALELIVEYAPLLAENPANMEAREAIGLASDLGAYAIMSGGTHGPHMTSFSLVDLAGHGTACGILNPYYAVFFAPVIEGQLRFAGNILKKRGYIRGGIENLKGRELGIAFAEGMMSFAKEIKAPVSLNQLSGWDESYVDKILNAAKDPQLEMKLRNMPLPLDASKVDECLGPVVRAAAAGDLSLVKSL